jgi:hypothetical protein
MVHETIELKLKTAGFAEIFRFSGERAGCFAASNLAQPGWQDRLSMGH